MQQAILDIKKLCTLFFSTISITQLLKYYFNKAILSKNLYPLLSNSYFTSLAYLTYKHSCGNFYKQLAAYGLILVIFQLQYGSSSQ